MEFQVLKYKALIAVAAFAVLAACTARIDIATQDAPPHLVIYGHISTEPGVRHYVRITRSAGYFATTAPEGLTGAIVTLTDDTQTHILEPSSEEAGIYLTEPGFLAVPGTTYTLDVEVDFNGDGTRTRYRAQTATPEQAQIDGVALEYSAVSKDHIAVRLSATLPPGGDGHYSVHVWRNDKMINDSLSRFTLFDDKNLATNVLVGVSVFHLDQEEERSRLEPGDHITIGLDAITADYSDFISYARREVSATIPFFSGPPANVPTNIQRLSPGDATPVAGFFSAYPRSVATVIWE